MEKPHVHVAVATHTFHDAAGKTWYIVEAVGDSKFLAPDGRGQDPEEALREFAHALQEALGEGIVAHVHLSPL